MYQYEFELNEQAYIACYEEHIKQSMVMKKLIWGCRLLIPLVILGSGYGITNKFENLFGLILYGILALVWGLFFPQIYTKSIRHASKKLLKESNDATLYDRRIVTISDEGISENIFEHDIVKKWKYVVKTIESEQYFFLYVTSQEAIILPKEVVGDIEQIEALKNTLHKSK